MATETPSSSEGIPSEAKDAAIISPEVLGKAYDLLQLLLPNHDGVVSSMQFRRELKSKLSLPDDVSLQCVKELQFLDSNADQRVGRKDAVVYHRGRSFVSKERYEEALEKTQLEAEEQGQQVQQVDEEEQPEREARQNRQEEARLGVYVKDALSNLYDSDQAPNNCPNAFDVHQNRPGGSFENVDLLVVHWRSESTVDLVTVEVKLEFSPKAVYQAASYTRFSHRVWVACVVSSEAHEAALELRTADPGLFDYAVNHGIGILGCRRAQGRSYQVFPVHWPAWHNPEPVEKERFVDRYKDAFEEAGVSAKKQRIVRF